MLKKYINNLTVKGLLSTLETLRRFAKEITQNKLPK